MSFVAPPVARRTAAGDRLVAHAPQSRTLLSDTWRQFRRHHLAVIGLVVFSVLAIASVLGPLVYLQPIDGIDMTARLNAPTAAHLMGTDNLGQDVLARVLFGGRVSLAVGIVAMLLSVVIGVTVGATAGYFRGLVDQVLMRVTDLFISLPQLPLLLLLIYFFRDTLRKTLGTELGTFVLIVAVIGGLRWMSVARLVRASFLSIQNSEYIEAARCIGVPGGRLVLRHLLPNALSPVIVSASLAVGSAILAESTLSFLGLGFPPDVPTWGRLLFDAKDHLDTAPHWAVFPGLMVFLSVLSINFMGDGLRDALDPRRVGHR